MLTEHCYGLGSRRLDKPKSFDCGSPKLLLRPEPYRTIVLVARCAGLRVEEILALPWENIHFDTLRMPVDRAAVHGRVQYVKTEYSEDELPLDPEFATVLLERQQHSNGSN